MRHNSGWVTPPRSLCSHLPQRHLLQRSSPPTTWRDEKRARVEVACRGIAVQAAAARWHRRLRRRALLALPSDVRFEAAVIDRHGNQAARRWWTARLQAFSPLTLKATGVRAHARVEPNRRRAVEAVP